MTISPEIQGKYFISVRSHSKPRVDILLDGKTIKSFGGKTAETAKLKAHAFARKNDITVERD